MLVIGLMNGTSADGIDAALVRIGGAPPRMRHELLAFHGERLDPRVRAAILQFSNVGHTTTADISNLNFLIGELFAQAALKLCKKAGISPRRIDLIGSHGQTVYHQGAAAPFLTAKRHTSTLQIGEPAVIAERTGVPVIADFRVADVAAGGQGAPLVPFVDYLLFAHPALARIPLNLGGIANVSVIPPKAVPEQVLAFDTGPSNMIVDALVSHFTRGRRSFDGNAEMAQRGKTHAGLLAELLKDGYFAMRPPKSTGREQYGAPYVERLIARARELRIVAEDLIRTATMLTPLTIVDAYHRFMLPHLQRNGLRADGKIQLILAGGGAHNPLIRGQLEALIGGSASGRGKSAEMEDGKSKAGKPKAGQTGRSRLPDVEIVTSAEMGVPEDAKEAFAFALLAYESWHGRPANLPSATGARHPVILGKVCRPYGETAQARAKAKA